MAGSTIGVEPERHSRAARDGARHRDLGRSGAAYPCRSFGRHRTERRHRYRAAPAAPRTSAPARHTRPLGRRRVGGSVRTLRSAAVPPPPDGPGRLAYVFEHPLTGPLDSLICHRACRRFRLYVDLLVPDRGDGTFRLAHAVRSGAYDPQDCRGVSMCFGSPSCLQAPGFASSPSAGGRSRGWSR